MFQNSNDIQILSVARSPRRYLILIRAGSNSRPSFFGEALPDNRDYDLGINYYAPPNPNDLFRTAAEVVFAGGLSKMHGAKRFFETTGLHEVYEGVIFLDDDVEILFNPVDFFALCREYSLHLAHPALTSDCKSPGINLHHPGLKLRTTNFVEVMAPFLVRDFLREMLHSFDLSISGWGLNLYWGHHLGQRWTAGIVDNFRIRHMKRMDLKNGAFYNYLESIGVNPYEDMRKILQMIGTKRYAAKPIKYFHHTYWYGF